jgi:hypothetical protein
MQGIENPTLTPSARLAIAEAARQSEIERSQQQAEGAVRRSAVRRQIADAAAREGGQVVNKNSWVHKNYGISGRTLLRYEREIEQAEAEAR